ncbi:MAG: tautomerase family protein [Candidatus Aminicenantes bacterium]|nr:tautomerase family protein [Candidatus Aminicenantes bacterium]
MPLVQTYLWSGIDDETVKNIVIGITKVFTDMGFPEEAVRVIIHEVPKSRWGIAGELASERKSTNKKIK